MRILALLLSLLLLLLTAVPAMAADVCSVSPASGDVTTDSSYIRVTCPDAEGSVTVSVTDTSGSLIYQKQYGDHSGTFRSDDIYLNAVGASYGVSLEAGEQTWRCTVTRKAPRLKENTASSAGYPLSEINGSDSRQGVTALDLAALEGGTLTVPVIASGEYVLGEATFALNQGILTVQAALYEGVDGTIDAAKVYVTDNALAASRLGKKSFAGITAKLNKPIDLTGSDYAVVYVKLTVSFDPEGLPRMPDPTLPGQPELMEIINTVTINEDVG